jgi:ribonuclease HII
VRPVIAGVDEAGRGPLAGPVFAAAVILDHARRIRGLADSKALSQGRREALAVLIRERALAFGVAFATVEEIDRLNILQASLLAMRRAVDALAVVPFEIWVDGNCEPPVRQPVRTVIGGDAKVAAISAASILAKTARDALMRTLALDYPEYGFDRHKGYPTEEHRAALSLWGPCRHHRRSYAPVMEAMAARGQAWEPL